jgi:hypothetical protein
MRHGRGIIATILLLAASAARLGAEETFYPVAPAAIPDAPWCAPDAPWVPNLYQPDGALIVVGTRIFRVCKGAVNPQGERAMRLLFNPRKVEGLRYDASMRDMVISDSVSSDQWLEIMLRSHIVVGTRVFGGVTYKEYDYSELIGAAGLLHSKFVYEPHPNDGDIPNHVIDCGDKSKRLNGQLMCGVFVFYKGMRAHTYFIGGVPGLVPIPRDKFPEIAQDMLRALQTADVTDQLDELRNQLPMLD